MFHIANQDNLIFAPPTSTHRHPLFPIITYLSPSPGRGTVLSGIRVMVETPPQQAKSAI
jgi:hypothetical protein